MKLNLDESQLLKKRNYKFIFPSFIEKLDLLNEVFFNLIIGNYSNRRIRLC